MRHALRPFRRVLPRLTWNVRAQRLLATEKTPGSDEPDELPVAKPVVLDYADLTRRETNQEVVDAIKGQVLSLFLFSNTQ